ncbi:hypothetical protein BK123_17290 [Paenibacillus lautus]|uniref:Uncharacterized protein n=1 Tax=Paenibacillus lautus TaxID=1401 RepID=A0A1R1B1G2_PAELA|nr:hypothetical protein BK123_17290 [Paenibacillus lautus]
MLLDHRHCITQLKELKKTGKFDDFPLMCPYAYTYVFWRKSLLKEEYFYGDSLCRTMENNSNYRSPLIIVEGQEHGPIESRYFSGFFILSVQVLVPSQGQEHSSVTD